MRTHDRRQGRLGELVLREDGGHFEIIGNGTFLMDTRDGASERLLVRSALDRLAGPGDVLIGGLGVGFSLAEALRSPRTRQVTVVECEPAVIGWHSTHLRRWSEGALDGPRVRVVCADLLATLRDSRPISRSGGTGRWRRAAVPRPGRGRRGPPARAAPAIRTR